MAATLAVAGLAGCGTPVTDAERYRAALTGPPADALLQCAAIENTQLAGECGAGAAVRLAHAGDGDAALAACGALTDPVWSEECAFEVVDALALTGPSAWQACAQAGRFRDYCVGHAVNRALADLPADALPNTVGQERQLVVRIRLRVRKMGVSLPKDHLDTVQFTAAARLIAQRWTDRPFDPQDCGVAEPRLCARAYAETMSRETVDWASVCAGPLTVEAVVAAGGTPWVAGGEAVVAPVWAALCVGDGQGVGDAASAPGPRPPQDGWSPE